MRQLETRLDQRVPVSSSLEEGKEKIQRGEPHAWVVSGSYGCGNTTFAKALAKRLGITDANLFNAGEEVRRRVATHILNYVDRSDAVDLAVDAETTRRIQIASRNNKQVAEAKVGGLIATDVINTTTDPEKVPSVLRVYIGVKDKNVQLCRIQKRENEKVDKRNNEMQIANALGQELNRERIIYGAGMFVEVPLEEYHSIEDIELMTRERARQDRAKWYGVHPEFNNVNPFDPDATDIHKNPIYDILLYSDTMSPEELVDEAFRQARELGWDIPHFEQ